MNLKFQTLLLIAIILAGFAWTKAVYFSRINSTKQVSSFTAEISEATQSLQRTKQPERNWSILNPKTSAKAILIQSLDSDFPFYRYETKTLKPIGTLTKFLTAVVILENINTDEKISITENAIKNKRETSPLRSGEIYSMQDLLKIMILTDSNEAAVAFEDFVGGKDEFLRLLNKKARELGMSYSIFYDAAGSSDLNQSNASDILILLKYIFKKYPEIFNWTRTASLMVQPINTNEAKIISNSNPLVNKSMFLGGGVGIFRKTQNNLFSIVSFKKERLAVIILGSNDSLKENEAMLKWIEKAYTF